MSESQPATEADLEVQGTTDTDEPVFYTPSSSSQSGKNRRFHASLDCQHIGRIKTIRALSASDVDRMRGEFCKNCTDGEGEP